MLTITIPESEGWDAEKEEFITACPAQTLTMEHSLLSVSKWESKWKKPFISKEPKSDEELIDYVRCMTLTKNVDPDVYKRLPVSAISQINDYIGDPMTATWFSKEENEQHSREVITSELIYYWMIASNIPFECQKWHLNRLMTLIRVCAKKNAPPKKMSKGEIMRRNSALNAARRKKLHTKG